MGCLLAPFAGVFPRMGLIIIWPSSPKQVNAAFDTSRHLAGILESTPFGTGWSQRRPAFDFPARA